ncbi:MAG: pseudouridine synthase [Acidobacteria bacterium]|nr:pseudouridine synthase [Acidobacteriota bacterium]
MLALNKPAGLLVAPDRWDKKRENLMGLLRAAKMEHLANAHRLDAGTSGVLLLAKTKAALSALFKQFRERTARKTYVALVRGSLSQNELVVSKPIAPHATKPGKAIINKRWGRPAETVFTILEQFRKHSLIRAEPKTGRLHQVRVHLQAAECALVADPDYGDARPLMLSEIKPGYKSGARAETPLIARPALHAESLTVVSPETGMSVTIKAPWPKDLALAVKYLKKFSSLRRYASD